MFESLNHVVVIGYVNDDIFGNATPGKSSNAYAVTFKSTPALLIEFINEFKLLSKVSHTGFMLPDVSMRNTISTFPPYTAL